MFCARYSVVHSFGYSVRKFRRDPWMIDWQSANSCGGVLALPGSESECVLCIQRKYEGLNQMKYKNVPVPSCTAIRRHKTQATVCAMGAGPVLESFKGARAFGSFKGKSAIFGNFSIIHSKVGKFSNAGKSYIQRLAIFPMLTISPRASMSPRAAGRRGVLLSPGRDLAAAL